MRVKNSRVAVTALMGLLLPALAAGPALAYDSEREQNNYRKLGERFLEEQATAEYQGRHLQTSAENAASLVVRDATSGGDRFSGTLCASGVLLCNRDHRLDDWEQYGERHQVVFHNRNGADIEGSVWVSNKTVRADVPVPGVVIETGSVQAPENWYRWAAQVLATHGYVVLSFDVQGQGRSDLLGEGDTIFRGVPAQDQGHFVESLQDALDFLLSAQNPLAGLVDAKRIGVVGHSLGASAVSRLQQDDLRIDAIVAWDNLSSGATPRVPALGMSADYGLVPFPHDDDPDPNARNGGFERWREEGVDAMQVNIRGGAHYEWSYSPSVVFIPPATLRGIDMSAWYTTAWLDRYVKGDPTADARLLTDRWHADEIDQRVDPVEDGNLFSFYHVSRVAMNRSDGTPVDCDDLRDGCGVLTADDGEPRDPPYSYVEDRKRGK